MKRMVIESLLLLLYFEFLMRFRGFRQVYEIVRGHKACTASEGHIPSTAQLCRAVDVACVFYFKEVLCLQRSAATTLLLRRHGADAEMVIGAQVLPFKSHAWVEIRGVVVNDKPYIPDIYQVLDRC